MLFRDTAAALAANGYRPVPIKPGSKAPIPDDWPHYVLRDGDQDRFGDAGAGVLCGETVPIDADVRNAKLAKQIEDMAIAAFGAAPRRIGSAPKVALFYRTDAPFRKLRSVFVRLPGDAVGSKPHGVEILGIGQQIVVYGVHPETRKDYTWNGSGDLLEVPVAQLGTISESDCYNFLQRVNALLLEHGTAVGKIAKSDHDHPVADAETEAFNREECTLAVKAISNTELHYDDWIYLGLAIKGALGEYGHAAWHQFSQQSIKYDRDETERAWRSFAPTKIGAGTLYKLAFAAGWNRPDYGVDISALLAPKEAPAVHRLIDWLDVARNPPQPREWAVHGWLAVGSMAILAGRGGIGKTLVMQQLASCLSIGREFLGKVERPVKALQWCAEDDADELKRRQIAIAEWLTVPIGQFQNSLYVEPLAGVDCALAELHNGNLRLTKEAKRLWEQINDLSIGVFMLDNIAHLYGGNENDRHQVTLFMNALTGMCLRANCAGILAGHPAKSTESEFSGSTAWENAVRTRFYLSRTPPGMDEKEADPESDVRYMAKRKANYSSLDSLRLTYMNGVLAPDSNPINDSPLLRGIIHEKSRRVVLEAVEKLAVMSQFCGPSSQGQNFLPKMIVKYQLAQGLHPSELERSMRQLMVDGKLIMSVVGKYSNRNDKLGLVVK
jgi:RecA-family ATPase